MNIVTAPARWPYALVTIGAKQHPALILQWERGYPPSPAQWSARVVYVVDGQARETLVLDRFVTKVGA